MLGVGCLRVFPVERMCAWVPDQYVRSFFFFLSWIKGMGRGICTWLFFYFWKDVYVPNGYVTATLFFLLKDVCVHAWSISGVVPLFSFFLSWIKAMGHGICTCFIFIFERMCTCLMDMWWLRYFLRVHQFRKSKAIYCGIF